jgi:alpha,alpha-trehalase
VTTLEATGEQWDAPSGWAPLHWMAVTGLRRYGHDDLADEIAGRWVDLALSSFQLTVLTAAKLDLRAAAELCDRGEYDPQYGVGGTNGVVKEMAARE